MNRKIMIKMGTDFVMTVLLLCQMAYMLVGETAHEWIGAVMFILFILHHALNQHWHRNLTKGRYTGFRILQVIVNFFVFICMIGLMISGMIMSRVVFAFLPIEGGMGFARILHMLAAYWGYILMSIHLGLHWGMIMSMVRKVAGIQKASAVRSWVLRGFALLICGFGICAFLKHNTLDYLFLRSRFVFFDMGQPLALFFAEYFAVMGLWVCIAYYAARILQKRSGRKGHSKNNLNRKGRSFEK